MDAVHDLFDGVNLIGPHHHQLLLAGNQHHVAADHPAQRTFDKERFGKTIEVGNFGVVLRRMLVDRQKTLVCIKCKVTGIIIGEIPGITLVADNKKLNETKKGSCVSVSGVVLIFDNLLHRPTRTNAKRLQFNLHDRHAINE